MDRLEAGALGCLNPDGSSAAKTGDAWRRGAKPAVVGHFGSRACARPTIPDWIPYAIEVEGAVRGFASYLRLDPPNGAVEIGSILYSPTLQRTTAATEAIYLMIRHAFANGYRRVEWKCDALNAPSVAAGERLGFRYEGTFRNATHYKGRNRDTAWFAITLEDWPETRAALESWLDPSNFDAEGRQTDSLASLRDAST